MLKEHFFSLNSNYQQFNSNYQQFARNASVIIYKIYEISLACEQAK